jgi:NAD(P)-dependent dehydrogenase (short-subunit alcohol dehydrogenase family)
MIPQTQNQQPGQESEMRPKPEAERVEYPGSNKLLGKVAIVTGGDSGIGRAVAIAFAKEGADVVIAYLNEDADANEARRLIEEAGRRCITVAGDLGESQHCQSVVDTTLAAFGRIDIVVNNAGEQHPENALESIDDEQILNTFRTNVFATFYLTRSALPHLQKGSSVINTTSVTAYRGSPHLLDYSATKGAIVSFTRSLSLALADRGIRVNAVAPGPIWTPLIPSTFDAEKVAKFGADTPMKRPGQPDEVAGCYVFLASKEASYISGQVLHPNGGEIING